MKIIEFQQQNFSNLNLKDPINFTILPEKSLIKTADFRIFKSPYLINENGEYDFVCYNKQGSPKDVGTVISVPTNQSLYVNKLCNNFNTITGTSCGILGIEKTDTENNEINIQPCTQERTGKTGIFDENCIPVTSNEKYRTLNDYLTDGIRKVPLYSTSKFGEKKDDEINIFNNFFTRELDINKIYDVDEELYLNRATEKFYLSLSNENTYEINDPVGWEVIDLYQNMVNSVPGQNYFYPYYLDSIEYPFYQDLVKYKGKSEIISPDFRCIFKSDSKGINNINFMNDAVIYYYGNQYNESSTLLNLIPFSINIDPADDLEYKPSGSTYSTNVFPLFPSFYAFSVLKNFSVVNTSIPYNVIKEKYGGGIISDIFEISSDITKRNTFFGFDNQLDFALTDTEDFQSNPFVVLPNPERNRIYDNRFRIFKKKESNKNLYTFHSLLFDNTLSDPGNNITVGDFIEVGIEYFMNFFYKFNLNPVTALDGKINSIDIGGDGINYKPDDVDKLQINNKKFSVYFSESYSDLHLVKQITVNFENSELKDKIKDQDILLIFISDYQLPSDINEIYVRTDNDLTKTTKKQIDSFTPGIFKPELTRVTNVTSKSFTLTRNIQNTTRKQLPLINKNGDISELIRVVNLGKGGDIIKRYFKITNVNKTGNLDSQNPEQPSSPYIEFEFNTDSISQDILENYFEFSTNLFYQNYNYDSTRSGFLPKIIPIKYIKSEYQSPYQKFNNTKENLNLCLYNTSNNNNLGNKFFSMITEIRISDVEIPVKESEFSEEKTPNQTYYFIKEFRNQEFFDVPQSELTFNIGDVVDFYDVINDNTDSKFSKIEKKITNFKFKIIDTNVILYDNIKSPDESEPTPIKNLYDYQCLLVGGNDSDFKIPETLFFFGNPTNSNYSLNKSRLYIDLMEPVGNFETSSPIVDIQFDTTMKRLDPNYYNPSVNTIKQTKYNSIGVLDLGYQTVTYATNFTSSNKFTYTENNFKGNKITTKHRFVLPHNVIYKNTEVTPSNNSLRGELILGTITDNTLLKNLNSLVVISKGTGSTMGTPIIWFQKNF